MNFFDFGARHYSPALTRWLTPDPLSEKYYGRSPYAYCNGDPVNLVDPNGKKVRLAKGSSKEFRSSYTKTVSHMRKMGVTKRLDQLYMSTKEYTIQETQFPDKSHFDSKTNTVYWDFKHAYRFANGLESSPTVTLIHELIHAARTDEASSNSEENQAMTERKNTEDKDYGDAEEKQVIEEETEAARALEELGPNQVARTDHKEATRLKYDYSQHDPEEVSEAIREHNKQFE